MRSSLGKRAGLHSRLLINRSDHRAVIAMPSVRMEILRIKGRRGLLGRYTIRVWILTLRLMRELQQLRKYPRSLNLMLRVSNGTLGLISIIHLDNNHRESRQWVTNKRQSRMVISIPTIQAPTFSNSLSSTKIEEPASNKTEKLNSRLDSLILAITRIIKAGISTTAAMRNGSMMKSRWTRWEAKEETETSATLHFLSPSTTYSNLRN